MDLRFCEAKLGRSSIKVTERHDAPWVKARQDQMEATVMRSWEREPLVAAQQSHAGEDF